MNLEYMCLCVNAHKIIINNFKKKKKLNEQISGISVE